ncbi:sulfite exporter TauE/SafE family protein [Aquibacillus albus]|uniref:Probable membrane transporter protein n=1 Tax=Aquibacillus albus TaxID=1168171 RepID=A0ABS2N3G9_9BACI|nr:sulfite exporter TauE/SafE family protein [Aquibacillus albus]MBM7572679.1 putative membrane protein YfcA [Aquibacillus albus]
MILWALPLGVVIGVMSGFFGVGGGFLLTPVLLLVGFTPVGAITMSLLYTIATSVSGAWAHFKLANIYWKGVLPLSVSGVIGTQIARPAVMWLERIGFDEIVIPVLYLVLLAYFAITMFTNKKIETKEAPTSPLKWKFLMIGMLGGFTSGALGVGGGFIMVPLLITIAKIQPKLAVGTSLISIIFIVTAGFLSYAFSTKINLVLASYLIIGAIIGTQLGPRFTRLYSNKQIQLLLGGLYVVTFLSVFLKLVNLTIAGLIVLLFYVGVLIVFFGIQQVKQAHKKKMVDVNS